MRRTLSVLIRDELKDRRVSPMVNITGVNLTPDLQYCKVFVSVLGAEKELLETLEGLKKASGFLRRELARSLNLRHTPELQFVADHSVEYGSKMDQLIREVKKQDEARPSGKPVNADNVYRDEETEEEW